MDSDDIGLSAEAMKALQEFMLEQTLSNSTSDNLLEEDWELSQFWYDDETSTFLATAALDSVKHIETKRIACVSSPSVYHKLLKFCPDAEGIYLFEYDKRFQEKYPNGFVFYDYKYPDNVDKKFNSYFDVVVADPPFLSEECLEKFAKTISILTDKKIILCTGAVMEELAMKHLNVHPSSFIPKHKRKLGNEFRCYVNFNFENK
ncbi:EEF1A lysine methyltransferase 1 [Parasteatoda tepidariorum]|uniref:EEF1A lysine methyltransferase 1 n=1 Tax=Parasteatoda tepidariorum TaxID=114398 RepID=UPI0039BD751A